MSRILSDDISLEELHVGIIFESMSGVPAQGNILVRDFVNVNYLFCSHPLYSCRVDEDYEEEYQAAGLDHACALFCFEDLESGKLSLCGEEISGLTIYRGWMMKPSMYRYLYEQLEKKNILLSTLRKNMSSIICCQAGMMTLRMRQRSRYGLMVTT